MFKRLKQHKVQKGASTWFQLPEAGHEDSRIRVYSATEANEGYYNAVLRKTGKRANMLAQSNGRRKGGESTAELKRRLARGRKDDLELYPEHIIFDFDKIPNDAHDDDPSAPEFVPFSKEMAIALVEAMPEQVFDEFRMFCSDHRNFVDVEPATKEDAEALGNA